MTQVTLTIKENKQAEALLRYLESLDFVKVERKITPRSPKPKAAKAAQSMRDFLGGLPNRSAKQSEINKAVKEIREGNFV
ncbi:hypothetical protein [Runella sp.]|uniref:hypothetical protein n=1 Tax=Runella sp. TaxID=1960881 RepID=UPI003D126804